MIAEACKHGAYTVEMVEEKVLSGIWHLWVGEKSAIVSEVHDGDIGRCCMITHAGGELQELLEMYTKIERMARDLGCVKMFISGRSGWKRVFAKQGFKDENLISKELQ